jgi:hypothetical protein
MTMPLPRPQPPSVSLLCRFFCAPPRTRPFLGRFQICAFPILFTVLFTVVGWLIDFWNVSYSRLSRLTAFHDRCVSASGSFSFVADFNKDQIAAGDHVHPRDSRVTRVSWQRQGVILWMKGRTMNWDNCFLVSTFRPLSAVQDQAEHAFEIRD